MANPRQALIVGGGLSGIFAALLLAQSKPKREVILIERAGTLGGLYSSFDCGDAGFFDHGPHLFYESCRPEVDSVIREVLPDSDWIFLSGNKKDIAGAYHHGVLQTNSNYMDLRRVDGIDLKAYAGDFFLNLSQARPDATPRTARDYFLSRFGPLVADSMLEPVVNKLWGCPSAELSPFVATMVTMDRIILFDSEVMTDLMKSDLIRSRLAYPEQTNLPAGSRASAQRGLYPKTFGLTHFVNAARDKLKRLGAIVIADAAIDALDIKSGEVRGAKIRSPSGNHVFSDLEFVHWTAGMPALEKQLGAAASAAHSLRTRRVVFVNALLKEPPAMGDNYYTYCFQPGFKTHRVTNFTNYCPAAESVRGFPISIELHFAGEEKIEAYQLPELALGELFKMGLVKDASSVLWSGVGPGNYMWPIPTLESQDRSRQLEHDLHRMAPSNLYTAGPSLYRNLFFLHDLVANSYDTLSSRIE